jgi:Tfp pilus assembly protein FimT
MLMRAGRVEEAAPALSTQSTQTRWQSALEKTGNIKKRISSTRSTARRTSRTCGQQCGSRRIGNKTLGSVAGITAESLNSRYVTVSIDNHYTPPISKQSVAPSQFKYISSWQVFQNLDHRHPTVIGVDQLPASFHRISAPLF